jgi:hypothetical protein
MKRTHKLDETIVRELLSRSDLTSREAGQAFGISPSTVQRVRRGELHASVATDIPRDAQYRRNGPFCSECTHYLREACSLELPECSRQGIVAASQCAYYATGRVL